MIARGDRGDFHHGTEGKERTRLGVLEVRCVVQGEVECRERKVEGEKLAPTYWPVWGPFYRCSFHNNLKPIN